MHRSRPTRRQFLGMLAVSGAAGLAWSLGGSRRPSSAPPARVTASLMGTTLHLTVIGDDREQAQAAANATLARMARLEGELSRYRADSAVGRLNESGHVDDAPDSLLEVLELARRVHELGDGAFDITIQPVLDVYRARLAAHHTLPADHEVQAALERVNQTRIVVDGRSVRQPADSRITLDGIGKGTIIDAGVNELRRRGFANVLVEAGGDLMAAGTRAGDDWRVGILRPRPGSSTLLARANARNCAVATSGDYLQPFTPDYRLHHILDPRTGRSSPGLASATVVAPTAAEADALATLVMVLGERRGRELLEALPGHEGCLVTKDQTIVRTTGFPAA